MALMQYQCPQLIICCLAARQVEDNLTTRTQIDADNFILSIFSLNGEAIQVQCASAAVNCRLRCLTRISIVLVNPTASMGSLQSCY